MSRLFLSYRRADEPDTVSNLHAWLVERLPDWQVFYDHECVPAGDPFPDRYREAIQAATVVLVVLGRHWLDLLKNKAAAGEVDHVREEVKLALALGKRVIPVTVNHAAMPTAADFAAFSDLARLDVLNGKAVRPVPSFEGDAEELARSLEPLGPAEGKGAVLARKYRLLRELPRGGMGVVYLAQQLDLERLVAVKFVDPTKESAEALARFDRERKTLASLNHPGIAKVFDAGRTPRGKPFFVMEYVPDGKPLTEFCNIEKLPFEERLALFRQVCDAVQHAHAAGIVHRDLKPDNVLVSRVDGKPLAKVIDFGLATAAARSGQIPLTEIGARVGTLLYAAPEQTEGRAADKPADVYSLGVLLYELLAGELPFTEDDLLAAGKSMRDHLSRPSDKLASSGRLPEIAEKRQLRPEVLRLLLRGEMDQIVMHALQAKPSDRYDSPRQFAQDIDLHLAGKPTLASRLSSWLAFKGFVKRFWKAAAATVASALCLVLGTAVSLWFWFSASKEAVRATRAEGEAKAERDAARVAQAEAERQRRRAEMALYAIKLRRAQQEWAEGRPDRAWESLLGCPPSMRDIEFRLLFNSFREGRIDLFSHNQGVTSVAFRPDGRQFVSADRSGTVKVWSVADSEPKQSISRAGSRIGYTPDGKRLIASSDEEPVRLLDAGTGGQSLVLHGSLSPWAVDPMGRWIAAVAKPMKEGEPPVLGLWEAATGKRAFALAGHRGKVSCLSFSPDGMTLVSGAGDFQDKACELKVWDLTARKERRSLPFESREVKAIAFSPDGRRMVSVAEYADLTVWDAASGKKIAEYPVPGGATGAAFTPDGRQLVVASAGYYEGLGRINRESHLLVLDASTGERVRTFKEQAKGFALSPEGDRIVSCRDHHSVSVWSLASGSMSAPFSPRDVAAISPDGLGILSGGKDRVVRLWDARTGKALRFYPILPWPVRGLSFAAQGRRIVAVGENAQKNQSFVVWDAASGEEVQSFSLAIPKRAGHATLSPTGRAVLLNEYAFQQKGVASVWDAATGKKLFSLLGHAREIRCEDFSPDGRRIATGSMDRTAKLWDASTGELLHTLGGHASPVSALAFNADGSRLVTGTGLAGLPGVDHALSVWDTATGKRLLDLFGHTNDVRSIAFTRDGHRILSASPDDTIRVWDAVSGQLLLSLQVPGDHRRDLALPGSRGMVLWAKDNRFAFRDAVLDSAPLVVLSGEAPLVRVAFNHDASELLTRDAKGGLRAWDPATGDLFARMPPSMPPGALPTATTPDGRIRARVLDGVVRVEYHPAIDQDRERTRRLLDLWARPDPVHHARVLLEAIQKADGFAANWHLLRLLDH